MTLALTCICGARLEIDAKFAGQTINCPDCNRPLDTAPTAPKPDLTSGLALASLLLALGGAFTLVGTILAIACGTLALKQIRQAPQQYGGQRLARAGILLGTVFTILTLILWWCGDLLKLDGLLRTMESAGSIEYTAGDVYAIESFDSRAEARSVTIKRPAAGWGRWKNKDPNNERPDDLVLVNLWEDAYITCLTQPLEQQPNLTLEDCRQEGIQRFLQSDLVTKILRGALGTKEVAAGQDRERKQLGSDTQEFLYDTHLGGMDWTFLLRVAREGPRLTIIAGGTRKNRFARLRPEIDKALDSYKVVKE